MVCQLLVSSLYQPATDLQPAQPIKPTSSLPHLLTRGRPPPFLIFYITALTLSLPPSVQDHSSGPSILQTHIRIMLNIKRPHSSIAQLSL